MQTLRVLVVDDNPHALTIVRMVLQGIGAQVRECADGRTGLDVLRVWPADVVIVDYEMRPISGVQFTRRLRAREGAARRTPVLMMTGHADGEHVSEAIASGIDGFVAKPISTGSLLDRLEAVMAAAARKLEKARARAVRSSQAS
jgi:CheY-like chemotaxis protein